MRAVYNFCRDYWRLMCGKPLVQPEPTFGPVQWDKAIVDQAIEMGRDKGASPPASSRHSGGQT